MAGLGGALGVCALARERWNYRFMRVGLVLDRFDVAGGGLERWTAGFADFLIAAGHAVEVLAFAVSPGATVPVHLLEPGRGLLARAHAVEAYLAGLELDAVLDTGTCWSGDVFLPCTGSRRLSQRRLVATHPRLRRLRAALSPRSRWLDWSMGRLERKQVRRARQVIAVSDPRAGRAVPPTRPDRERIVVIPNGVETARFTPERMARCGRRRGPAWAWAMRRCSWGSAHNLWLKGMDTAIRALPERSVLVIAGGVAGSRHGGSLRRARTERVRFLGVVDDMAPLFAAADAHGASDPVGRLQPVHDRGRGGRAACDHHRAQRRGGVDPGGRNGFRPVGPRGCRGVGRAHVALAGSRAAGPDGRGRAGLPRSRTTSRRTIGRSRPFLPLIVEPIVRAQPCHERVQIVRARDLAAGLADHLGLVAGEAGDIPGVEHAAGDGGDAWRGRRRSAGQNSIGWLRSRRSPAASTRMVDSSPVSVSGPKRLRKTTSRIPRSALKKAMKCGWMYQPCGLPR